MSRDELQRARDVATKAVLASKWDSKALRYEFTLLVRRREGWISELIRELLIAFFRKPLETQLRRFLDESVTFQNAVARSRSLRECVPTWERVAIQVAEGLMEVTWSPESQRAKLRRLTKSKAKWIATIVRDLFRVFPDGPQDKNELAFELLQLKSFDEAYANSRALKKLAAVPRELAMKPAPGAPETWKVPEILSPQMLTDWFAVPLHRILRLADDRLAFQRNTKPNYRYRSHRKPSGGVRLIEAPNRHLRQLQRDISDGILAQIPLHDCAHGFRTGRNIKTYTESHVGQAFVMRMDLQDFFPSINRTQVAAIFRTAGYPEPVVELLAKLTTHRTPRQVLENLEMNNETIDQFRQSHLPQGAPSSPALANLAAYRLDRRLAGLAKKFTATYTRYADDLLFSGNEFFARSNRRFHVFVLATILDEGFLINPRKTHRMRRGVRQRAAGLSLNDKVNTNRRDYEKLKAILHNCAKFGPESQNRNGHTDFGSHLRGLVEFHALVNPQRGEKLKRAWERVFV